MLSGGMDAILHKSLPVAPWMTPATWRLPGIQPVSGDDWLRVDEAYAGQMRERDRLIAERLDAVHGVLPRAMPAALELYDLVLARLRGMQGFAFAGDFLRRPDGVQVALDRDAPLVTLGRLLQEDLCILEDVGGEHLLTGAILCFPASWTLAQKLGRSMVAIHVPVDHYTAEMARRVQRLFDAIRVEQPLWRANALVYDDPELHQPRPEGARRPPPVTRDYMRVERQCLLRLPKTQAVVFTIHTYLVRMQDLTVEQRAGLADAGI